ncbi:hypothetical protein, partial [Chryseobacterium arthrosphaerae]
MNSGTITIFLYLRNDFSQTKVDLKQLLIYFALKQMSDKTNWEFGQLYNPRSGLAFKFELKELISKISGGKSQSEAFESLLNGLVRKVQ